MSYVCKWVYMYTYTPTIVVHAAHSKADSSVCCFPPFVSSHWTFRCLDGENPLELVSINISSTQAFLCAVSFNSLFSSLSLSFAYSILPMDHSSFTPLFVRWRLLFTLSHSLSCLVYWTLLSFCLLSFTDTIAWSLYLASMRELLLSQKRKKSSHIHSKKKRKWRGEEIKRKSPKRALCDWRITAPCWFPLSSVCLLFVCFILRCLLHCLCCCQYRLLRDH